MSAGKALTIPPNIFDTPQALFNSPIASFFTSAKGLGIIILQTCKRIRLYTRLSEPYVLYCHLNSSFMI